MNIDMRRMYVRLAVGVGLLAVTAMSGRDWPMRAGAAEKAESIVADWPEPSRQTALAMIEKHGQPNRRGADSLTWYGLFSGRRTVVHRSASGDDAVEQVVLYRVPAAKAEALTRFDNRIKVDRSASELSVRTESARTNFLLLNLAHEIASGFRTVGGAQRLRDRELRLAGAGKSSRYREGLMFEGPLPTVRPGDTVPPPEGASAP